MKRTSICGYYIHTLLPTCLLACLWASPIPAQQLRGVPPQGEPAIETTGNCTEAVALLEEQNRNLSREFRQLKREIALLRQDFEKPGLPEIIGGIGYILGLFGIAAYVASRRKPTTGS